MARTDQGGAKPSLRNAATALLAAWDADADLTPAIDALRAALSGAKPVRTAAPRAPRQGTKQEAVLTLLARPDGTTIAQIVEVTGWQQHTVRGFMAGLKKKGTTIEVIDRVRMVGPNRSGSPGSYSTYRAR